MKSVCSKNLCRGCAACVSICPKKAIHIKDNLKNLVAEIDESKCIECQLCHNICPVNCSPEFRPPMKWYQGWAKSKKLRMKSSSGGASRCITEKFIREGGIVCSCVFEDGQFIFKFVDNVDEADIFVGSKYVKSNPQNIYLQLKAYLKIGKKVLFIGLPCQVAGILNYCGYEYKDSLYTIDLICHGTPSIRLLEMFLEEAGYKLSDISKIQFRDKNRFALGGDIKLTEIGVMDRYTIAFLTGSCYTENCYFCDYARKNRISDMTLGDSWGSELICEEGNGISLILCQTNKGIELLNDIEFELKPVDLQNAIAANHQLNAPSKRPDFLDNLYNDLADGKKFSSVVFRYCRMSCIKQLIKHFLIKIHIIKGAGV